MLEVDVWQLKVRGLKIDGLIVLGSRFKVCGLRFYSLQARFEGSVLDGLM